MPNANVYASIVGDGECLIISVSATGAFSLSKGKAPVGSDVVPVTCDIVGPGTDFVVTRAVNNSHTSSVRKKPEGNRSVVPVFGRAAGAITSININASTGVIRAGARSTTVAALFV